jgi:hypothetical protein
MAAPVNNDGERWVESPLFGLILLLGRLLLALLLAYWICFVGYSIGKMVMGGPGAVVAWYAHIEAEGNVVFLPHWSAAAFLVRQLLILAITGGLWFAVGPRRIQRRAS